MFLHLAIALVITQPSQSIGSLEREGYVALRAGNTKEVQRIAEQIAKQHPGSFESAMSRGSLLLRSGSVKPALEAFDEAAELEPRQVPYMWQRGIAQYYAGEYEAGRKQFVVHREVNPHDVENAVWHFLCVAQKDSFDSARKGYLPAPGDGRAPMQQVYELFGGEAEIKDVVAAMKKFPEGSGAATSAGFYGELYLGLYEEVRGNTAEAKQWLEKAVARGQKHYMGDVAAVHLQQLNDALKK